MNGSRKTTTTNQIDGFPGVDIPEVPDYLCQEGGGEEGVPPVAGGEAGVVGHTQGGTALSPALPHPATTWPGIASQGPWSI